MNYAVDFKIGDVNGDGRQDLVYIKDRNCTGNDADRDPLAASPTRFRFMVALGNENGLDVSDNANVYPRCSPTGEAGIPSCNESGVGTTFDDNEKVRWDLIWHLFDLTGDGREDLIAQSPDFGTCATCYRWKVYPATPVGARWTFSASGVDLGIATSTDTDSYFTDLTGDGLPELMVGSPSGDLLVRALRRVTGVGVNLAYEFEPTNRSVSFAGFEPDIMLSFGTSERDSLRSGDLNGDGIADLILHATKIRVGVQCDNGTARCVTCGGPSEPACEDELMARCGTVVGDLCTIPPNPPLPTGPQPRWQNASSVELTQPRQVVSRVKYWLTAKVTPVGNDFVVSAGQCVGSGTNAASATTRPETC